MIFAHSHVRNRDSATAAASVKVFKLKVASDCLLHIVSLQSSVGSSKGASEQQVCTGERVSVVNRVGGQVSYACCFGSIK